MKVLFATTCIAVIAAVGYFFWHEYDATQRGQAVAASAADRARCLEVISSYVKSQSATLEPHAEDCVMRGLVTADEIMRAR